MHRSCSTITAQHGTSFIFCRDLTCRLSGQLLPESCSFRALFLYSMHNVFPVESYSCLLSKREKYAGLTDLRLPTYIVYPPVAPALFVVSFEKVNISGAVNGQAVWPSNLKPIAWHRASEMVKMKLGLYHSPHNVSLFCEGQAPFLLCTPAVNGRSVGRVCAWQRSLDALVQRNTLPKVNLLFTSCESPTTKDDKTELDTSDKVVPFLHKQRRSRF